MMNPTTLAQSIFQAFGEPKKQSPLFMAKPKLLETAKIAIAQAIEQIKQHKINRLQITAAHLPTPTEQERQSALKIHHQILHDLWHGQNLDKALARAEMCMNLLKIILALYRDEDSLPAAHALFGSAIDEICTYNDNTPKHTTPEENRHAIKSVEYCFDLLFEYSEFTPAPAFDSAAIYNSGCQVINYYTRLMNTQPEYVAAAFRVIRGASLESTATKSQLKQSNLRTQTLLIGQMLYRMGFVSTDFEKIQPAQTIPQLRTPEYTELTHLDTLKSLAIKAKNEFCLPFENTFGVSQIDWAKYQSTAEHGHFQISRLLFQAA